MALFVLSLCPFDISVGVGAFVIGLSQISSFFSWELRRNQTLLMHENSKIQTEVNQTMSILNDLKGENEELRRNQTNLQHEATRLKTVTASLENTVSALQPGDFKLNLLNPTIQALHTVHSSTAAIVTSLQGKQKTMDGSIMSLNASLRTLHGSVGIDVAALNSSLMKLDQHVNNLNVNVNKNTNGNNNCTYSC